MSVIFNVEGFKHQLHTTWLGSEFIYLEKVNSTSSWLKQIPSGQLVHGTVVFADHQTKGRGQYERRWEADPGENLTFTIGFCPPTVERCMLLTLACAWAISTVLEKQIPDEVKIKWPNDLLIRGKKIGGLLTEGIFNGQRLDRILVGIGLNIGQTEFSKDVDRSATSLTKLSGQTFSREQLLSQILGSVEKVYHQWVKRDRELQKKISQKMIGYGEWVTLSINGVIQTGTYKFLGVNEKGECLVLNEQLDVHTFLHEQIRIIPGRKTVSASKA